MKEIASAAANHYICINDDGAPVVMTELVLNISEPVYESDGGGGYVKRRTLNTVRIHAGIKQLKALAQHIEEYAVIAELLKDRVTIAPEDEA
jgi:hypothetical protein